MSQEMILTRRAALAAGLSMMSAKRGAEAAELLPLLYVGECSGQISRFRLADGEMAGSRNVVEQGWAPPIRDGCVVTSFSYQPDTESLFTVVPLDAMVDINGLRRFRILRWDARSWELTGSADILEPLSATPNVLVPRAGQNVLLAYETPAGSGMAPVLVQQINDSADQAKLARNVVHLPGSPIGPWFSSGAVLLNDDTIHDDLIVMPKSPTGWNALSVQFPTADGGPWKAVGLAVDKFFFSSIHAGQTLLLVTDAQSRTLRRSQLNGGFGARQLFLSPNGTHVVSAGTSAPATLWDVESGKAIAVAPKEWGLPQYPICVNYDGTSVIRAEEKLYLFGPDKRKGIAFDHAADQSVTGVFADH